MSNPPPHEHSSGTPPALDELLLQVESLKQSNNIVAYISLLRQILQLPSLQGNPSTWAVLQFALGNALHQHAEGDRKSQLQNNKGNVFLSLEEATLPQVLDVLRRGETGLTHVHFACHGLAELADPQISGILLAYGARLMTRDLLNPEFVRFAQLRLAVLAACRTALVGTELPDEAVGLPSAWLQAGVLASLWPISDSWTLALMTKFYELHLLDEREPVEALWLAQRWLRGLPSWREDCRAAGAVRAAEGPEVNEVVSVLGALHGRGRGIDGQVSSEEDMRTEERKAASRGNAENRGSDIDDRDGFWEDARHWAAFAIYGA